MKNWTIICFCLLSSFSSAAEIEEVVVKARQVKIVIDWKLSEKHKQNPITGNWYYVADKDVKKKDKA